jgi:microsomal dipeptidase-like Zn-dependent dipeptidase
LQPMWITSTTQWRSRESTTGESGAISAGYRPPNGLDDVSKMPPLIVVLLKRGYTKRNLKKILGENFLRVIREIAGS